MKKTSTLLIRTSVLLLFVISFFLSANNAKAQCNLTGLTCNFKNANINLCNLESKITEVSGLTGGTAPYTINWNYSCPGLDASPVTGVATNVTSFPFYADTVEFNMGGTGTFYVTVTDANGCTATGTCPIQVTACSSPSISVVAPPSALCPCQKLPVSFTSSASFYGNNDFILYLVTPSGALINITDNNAQEYPSSSNSGTIPALIPCNIPAGSDYKLQINSNGPAITGSKSSAINIDTVNFTVAVTQTNATCGNANGSINLSITGTSGSYSYLWNMGDTTENLSNLATGIYSVTIHNASACSVTDSFTVTNTTAPTINETHSNIICADSLGNINLTVTGGTAPYSFYWNNGDTIQNITNLAAGTYMVTVEDKDSCPAYATININNDVSANYYVFIDGIPSGCKNNNGSLIAEPNGGIAPYTYLWSNNETTQTDTGLAEGNYSVVITDFTGCPTSGSQTVSTACSNIIMGKIYNDNNHNCIYDTGDTPCLIAIIKATNGTSTYYGYTNDSSGGNYIIYVPTPGTYTITVSQFGFGGPQYCTSPSACGGDSIVTFNSLGDSLANNNYGFGASTGFDLTLRPGWDAAKPGFEKKYWIYYYNQSYSPYPGANATITFTYDSSLIYDSSSAPLPVYDALAHTLTWSVSSVPYPSINAGAILQSYFEIPASLPTNYAVKSNFSITPTAGDCDTTNNYFQFYDSIAASYDPNRKEVSPAGPLTGSDSVLTYTINFQNTGNDTTNFIIVMDTLSSYLDGGTVRNLASSNNYEFSILGTGILKWVFNPIFLPDSTVNASGSKGFIIFSVKINNSVLEGAQITNNASIYFDYNTPVKTNTVTSTFIGSVAIAITNVETVGGISIYPNPTAGNVNIVLSQPCYQCLMSITDVVGRNIFQELLTGQQSIIDMNGFTSGIYFIRVSTAGETQTMKVVKTN